MVLLREPDCVVITLQMSYSTVDEVLALELELSKLSREMRSEGNLNRGLTCDLDVIDMDRDANDDVAAPVKALHLVVDPMWRASEGGGALLELATESARRVAKPCPWLDEVKSLHHRVGIAIVL